MPDPELWDGEREQRWQIMERMEEDRAKREADALASGSSGPAADADYQRRLAEQGLKVDQAAHDQADTDLTADVRQQIMEDRELAASEITVRVTAGEVTLSGMVESTDAKQRAQLLAEQVGGVSRVVNHLEVF